MLRFLKRNTEREQIMELLYLYINLSESEFIEKKGFNFSPNYNFEVNYQNGTYILSSKKQNDCVPNGFFDGDGCISNITTIVGENGSGKTTLLDYILYSGIVSQPDKDKKYYDFFIDKFKYREQIAVYKDKDKLVCYHNMKNFISLGDIECIDITKDSKAYSNMLKNNDGFKNITKIRNKLQTLYDVGLGYIKIGQSSTTLSGGEAQRVKLATELSKTSTGKTLYILDEPTTGLHTDDVKNLISMLNRLVDNGNTAVIIEHNLDVIKSADYIIDLGPEGGGAGGEVIATGTPEEVAKVEKSYTGQFLKKILKY